MDLAGIEPASEVNIPVGSTCLVLESFSLALSKDFFNQTELSYYLRTKTLRRAS